MSRLTAADGDVLERKDAQGISWFIVIKVKPESRGSYKVETPSEHQTLGEL